MQSVLCIRGVKALLKLTVGAGIARPNASSKVYSGECPRPYRQSDRL